MNKRLDIIYEDQNLIAVNKAAGMLTLPDRFRPDIVNLRSLLKNKLGDIFVVHRLDVETSGVILFAKTAEAHKILQDNWAKPTTTKIYQALTLKPALENGIVNAAIVESQTKRGFYKVHDKGREAITHYKVISSWRQYALMECTIKTGRTHQIRVHMKYIGAALLVDKKYGSGEAFFLSQIKRIRLNNAKTERPLMKRSSLHAATLIIKHPITGISIQIDASHPKDFKAVINQFNKVLGKK